MLQSKKFYMRVRCVGIGPGGWNCACCAPPKGKKRKQWVRRAKKLERLLIKKAFED